MPSLKRSPQSSHRTGHAVKKQSRGRSPHAPEAGVSELLQHVTRQGHATATPAQVQALQRKAGNQAVARMIQAGQLHAPQAAQTIQRVELPSDTPPVSWWNKYLFDLQNKGDWKIYSNPDYLGSAATFDGLPIHITVSADSHRSPGKVTKSSSADALIHNMLSRVNLYQQDHATLDVVKGDPQSNPHYYWMGPGSQGRDYDLQQESHETLFHALTNFANTFIKPKVEEAIKSAPS